MYEWLLERIAGLILFYSIFFQVGVFLVTSFLCTHSSFLGLSPCFLCLWLFGPGFARLVVLLFLLFCFDYWSLFTTFYLLPISQCVCCGFSISCFISLPLLVSSFAWSCFNSENGGFGLGSSITGSMHPRIVVDIYLGCNPARVKVFSGLFEHFFPLMSICYAHATTLTGSDPWNFHGFFSGLRLQFRFGVFLLLVYKTIYVFFAGATRHIFNTSFPVRGHLLHSYLFILSCIIWLY